MIVHRLLDCGAFVAGDTDTGETSYAYPTSDHARRAKRYPDLVAREMIKRANASASFMPSDISGPYNARQWASLSVAVQS